MEWIPVVAYGVAWLILLWWWRPTRRAKARIDPYDARLRRIATIWLPILYVIGLGLALLETQNGHPPFDADWRVHVWRAAFYAGVFAAALGLALLRGRASEHARRVTERLRKSQERLDSLLNQQPKESGRSTRARELSKKSGRRPSRARRSRR